MNEKLNGTLSRCIKKLAMQDPESWDVHVPAVLYAYRTKVHQKLKISPYEMLFGQEIGTGDPILELGRELGFERYSKLTDRNRLNELLYRTDNSENNKQNTIHEKLYKPGDIVVKLRQSKKNKLDSNYEPKQFKIIASYSNNTYKLCDMNGQLLKRHLNHANIKKVEINSQQVHHMGGE